MTFYRLLDFKNNNTVVRAEGRSQQQYILGRGWIESGIMIEYFCDESDTYNMYEEITEQQANKIISKI